MSNDTAECLFLLLLCDSVMAHYSRGKMLVEMALKRRHQEQGKNIQKKMMNLIKNMIHFRLHSASASLREQQHTP